jgi:prepilin-type processing-associated H-X9-DG protein
MEGGQTSLLEARRYASDCACYLLPYERCRLLVTTAEGDSYVVLALAATENGINLEYRKLPHRPTQPDLAKAARQQDRVNSAQKLSGLGQAVAMYAADNNGKLPGTLQKLKPYIEHDFQWLVENVRYLGKGQESKEPDTPIAYDKTLLEKGNGTNVLFIDGHVEFLTPEELKTSHWKKR